MAVYICSLPSISWRFTDVRREFMQRLYVDLHGTLGSYIRDALHEGGASPIACLHAPRA
jgi:hypothetical protein